MPEPVQEALTIDWEAVRALSERVRDRRLAESDFALIVVLLSVFIELGALLSRRDATLARLRQMVFGPRTDRRRSKAPAPRADPAQGQDGSVTAPTPAAPRKRPGHGRKPASAYTGAQVVTCTDPVLGPGQACPDHPCPGSLHTTREPNRFLRFVGQAPVGATRFDQTVLRCSACQHRYEAPLPEGVVPERWDPSADVSIVMGRYAAGLPFYRFAKLQAAFGVPLSESVLWERVLALAEVVRPVAAYLERMAASAELLFCDDTPVRILSLMAENKTLTTKQRRGMQTTAMLACTEGQWIVLYRSGRNHAGENVGALLELRPKDLPPPVQMSDALAANFSHKQPVVPAKCLAHGRRNFVTIERAFPQECERVLDAIGAVYRIDAEAKARKFTGAERLAYHQQHSGPILQHLRVWIEQRFEQRLVEPSSSLGDALCYLLDHYDDLTRFLTAAGAPLDNTPCERVLKLAVLSRKNSLFYKTQRGASTGDLMQGLIETCRLAGVPAAEYLLTLARHAEQVKADPARWLPWTYRTGEVAQAA